MEGFSAGVYRQSKNAEERVRIAEEELRKAREQLAAMAEDVRKAKKKAQVAEEATQKARQELEEATQKASLELAEVTEQSFQELLTKDEEMRLIRRDASIQLRKKEEEIVRLTREAPLADRTNLRASNDAFFTTAMLQMYKDLTAAYSSLTEETYALDRYIVQLNLYLSFRFMYWETATKLKPINQDVLTFAYGIAEHDDMQDNAVLYADPDERKLTAIESAVAELLFYFIEQKLWSNLASYVNSAVWTMDVLNEQWGFVDQFMKGKLRELRPLCAEPPRERSMRMFANAFETWLQKHAKHLSKNGHTTKRSSYTPCPDKDTIWKQTMSSYSSEKATTPFSERVVKSDAMCPSFTMQWMSELKSKQRLEPTDSNLIDWFLYSSSHLKRKHNAVAHQVSLKRVLLYIELCNKVYVDELAPRWLSAEKPLWTWVSKCLWQLFGCNGAIDEKLVNRYPELKRLCLLHNPISVPLGDYIGKQGSCTYKVEEPTSSQ